MRSIDLNGSEWRVRAASSAPGMPAGVPSRDLPASVPGCVHTDLVRAGVIAHPAAAGDSGLQWIGEADWEYRRTVDLDTAALAAERLDLVCDGLDTIAELTLNGVPIGTAANMFHPHRFDLRRAARPGSNDLRILFRSPLRHARAEQARLGPRPFNGDHLGWEPFPFIRKAACHFGWDFAPRVATCGVWQSIRLEAWSGVRIAAARVLPRREGDAWTVHVHADLEWSDAGAPPPGLMLAGRLRDEQDAEAPSRRHAPLTLGQPHAVLAFPVDRPKLWWPRGHGDQPLYQLQLACISDAQPWGKAPARTATLGLREVRLNTDADVHGRRFQIEINGRPIFCKGANWVPEGLFPDDRSPEVIRTRVRQAADAHMNMLRVWGGGHYESDEFYGTCDRLGILVWQDFMFACACYPEEPPFPTIVEAEARHQIARLSPHPSVVLWCGGNECAWGRAEWGAGPGERRWLDRLGTSTWGAGYFLGLLPRLLAELDPTRPYWPNSPWPGDDAPPANDHRRGDRHVWDALPDLAALAAAVPRFASEFGLQSPSNPETFAGITAPESRQRATGGSERHIVPAITALAGVAPGSIPQDFDAWCALARQAQARGLLRAIETLAADPRCMGALVWQFNECWPGFSWSLVDAAGRPKPAYAAVREAFGRITR